MSHTKDLTALSELLKGDLAKFVKSADAYANHAMALIDKSNIVLHDKEFIKDCLNVLSILASDKIVTHRKIAELETAVNESNDQTGQDSSSNNSFNFSKSIKTTINMNQLVVRPVTFNGYKPKPRKWLDDFKYAIKANDWNDIQIIKYFPSWLDGTAKSWFKNEIDPIMDDDFTWDDLEAKFTDNYLGQGEFEELSAQLDKTRQGANEPITSFIPRVKELLIMIDPMMSEAEQVRNIRRRIKDEHKRWVAFANPTTVDQLKKVIMSVEINLDSSNDNNRTRRDSNHGRTRSSRNNTNSKQGRSSSDNQNDKRSNGRKCYICSRTNHEASKCFAKVDANGKPVKNPNADSNKPKLKKGINVVSDANNQQSNQQVDNPEPATNVARNNFVQHVHIPQNAQPRVITTRRINMVQIKNNQIMNINSTAPSPQIRHIVSCNEDKIDALIDTGCSTTVVSLTSAQQSNWKIEKIGMTLEQANGEPLDIAGFVSLDVSIQLGKTTKTVKHEMPVINKLAEPMLIGMDLLNPMAIIINCRSNTISFEQKSIESGIRLINDTIVPPRSSAAIPISCNMIGTVMVVAANYNQSVLIGNSITEIIDNRGHALILNPSIQEVKLEAGTKLTDCDLLNPSSNGEFTINRIEKLSGTQDTIQLGDNLSSKQQRQLMELLNMKIKAFAVNGKLGRTELAEHQIELEDGARPQVEPMRRRPQAHVEETRRQVKQMLEEGIIEPSDSPWASAYVLAKKKSGELRLCVDFRKLNLVSKKLSYPLPNTDDCLETIAGKNYFSLIDFASGFWQIPVARNSRELTAFRTEDGLFQFKRMPFGLANAPASFQRMINALLSGMKGINLQVFMDDICIATDTWEEHLKLLAQLFDLVIKSGLRLKSSKCVFGAHQVVFLGHLISATGIRQDPDKLKAILAMPRPKDAPGVKRVLGLLSYYRKFVPKFAILAEPLTNLTKKKTPFVWGKVEQDAYDKLLFELAKNATLTNFDHTLPIILKTDASRQGIAGMLLQKANDEVKLVTCCSRRLSSSEANYGITDLEGLAVIYSITKFRHYLIGKHFQLLVDHCPLCVLKSKTPTSSRLARWAIILSEFSFDVIYTKGDLHQDIDCLSRAPVDDPIDPFVSDKLMYVSAPIDPENWVDDYYDEEGRRILEKAIKSEEDLNLVDHIIYKGRRLYIPTHHREGILRDCHSNAEAGHGGLNATLYRMSNFWWPTMKHDVKEFIKACQTCQSRKAERTSEAGTHNSFEIYSPNKLVAFDCLGKITQSLKGNEHIIVSIDMFTRYIDAKAVPNITAANFAEFLTEYSGRFGVPEGILTDNGPTFKNKTIKDLTRSLKINHQLSTPEHSRGNAVVERAIQTLQEKINLIIKESKMTEYNWDTVLPLALLSINTSLHATTGYSPFQLTFGLRPALRTSNCTTSSKIHELHAELIQARMDEMYGRAADNQIAAQTQAAEIFNSKHRKQSFNIGDLVLVKTRKRRSKLSDRFKGPYRITKVDKEIYQLESLEDSSKLTRHVSALKPFYRQNNQEAVELEVPDQIESIESPDEDEDEQEAVQQAPVASPSSPAPSSPTPIINQQALMQAAPEVPPKRGRGRPRKQVMFIKALAKPILALFISTCMSQASHLVRVSPQIWTPSSDTTIEMDEEYFAVEMFFDSPCKMFKNLPANDQHMFETCENLHHKEVTLKLATLPSVKPIEIVPRLKRGIFNEIRDFVTGCFVGNGIRSLIDKIFIGPELEAQKRFRETAAHRVNEVREQIDYQAKINNETASKIDIVFRQVEDLEQKLNTSIERNSVILPSIAYTMAEVRETATTLRRLMRGADQGRLDIQRVYDLIDYVWPPNINDRTVKLINITSSKSDFIRIEFKAELISNDTQVYDIDAFIVKSYSTQVPTYRKYVGPTQIVYNSTAKCATTLERRDIRMKRGRKITNKICDTPNYSDPLLSRWEEQPTRRLLPTQVKFAPPKVLVTCDEKNDIQINNETHHCSPFTFALELSDAFNTSDYSYAPHERSFKTHSGAIIPPLSLTNITMHKEHHDAGKLIRQLNDQLIQVNWDKPMLDPGDYVPSFKLLHACIGLTGTVFLLVLTFYYYCQRSTWTYGSKRTIPDATSQAPKRFTVSKV